MLFLNFVLKSFLLTYFKKGEFTNQNVHDKWQPHR